MVNNIYEKKNAVQNWNTSANEILDYDLLKDNGKFSKPNMSRKMMMKSLRANFVKTFLEWQKVAALNHERFTLATDDKLRYNWRTAKWFKKYQQKQKYVILVKFVEGVAQRKEPSFKIKSSNGNLLNWIRKYLSLKRRERQWVKITRTTAVMPNWNIWQTLLLLLLLLL